MLETEWISAVLGITLKNSLISQRQHIPTRCDFLSQLISPPGVSPVSPLQELVVRWARAAPDRLIMSRDLDLCSKQKRERKKWQVRADASAVFAKSHRTLTRDTLVITANKKRTDECINGGEATHRLWSCSLWPLPPGGEVTPGGGEGWEGIIAAPRWSLCIWNLPELIICAPPWDAVAGHQAQEIYSPAERRGWAASVPRIVEITNQMHAGLIACRQGETFGTLIIKLKLNLNC